MSTEQREVDFLVVGSGAGGMAAALAAADAGMNTLVIEKSDVFGGSTALSGGGIWIPNNPTLKAAGHDDSRESVLAYLRELTAGRVSEERLKAYVDNGPDLMRMLERTGGLKFFWVKDYSDYHPEYEGGRPRGRSVEARPFDTRALGEDEQYQKPNTMRGPLGLWITAKDYHHLAMVRRTWNGRRMMLVAAWRVATNLVRRRNMATGGRALAARLRLALRRAGVAVWLSTPMRELIVEDGVVTGVRAESGGQELELRAKHGVLLACGGFEHDGELRDKHLPEGGRENYSSGADENTGDAHRAGQQLGAELDLMDDAWWMPSVRHPRGTIVPLVSERAIPCSIIVSGEGERFTNEASPYVNFVHDQLEGGHVPAWFVMDAKARKRYPFAQAMPGQPLPRGYYRAGVAHSAGTLAELADSVGLDVETLTATVRRFNEHARTGRDPDYGRGNSAYDRYYGDPTLTNPNLDVIDEPPYYAVRIEVGDLGTKGGLVSDEHGRVLRPDGSVIDGLYVTGNAASAVMGNEYAGPGATIGPAMVFGYLAANDAARRRVAAGS